MDRRELDFVQNYPIFGSGSKNRYRYTKKQRDEIKAKYKKQGVYLLPNKKIADTNMPAKTKKNEDCFSALQFSIAALNPVDQENIIEMVKQMPSAKFLQDFIIAVQMDRLNLALQNEKDLGKTLDTTEGVVSNLQGMITAKHNMNEGQEINVNVNNSITDLIKDVQKKNDNNDDNEVIIDLDKSDKSVSDYLPKK